MLQKECLQCSKMIDEDSLFCKYCGQSTDINNNITDERKMRNIFQSVYDTLHMYSTYTDDEFANFFEPFKNYENRELSDNDYYLVIVDIIFYSGFKASTVDKYLDRIHNHFPHYETVCNYTIDELERIKKDPKMIKNKLKIDACFKNALNIKRIIEKYGSMKKYINSFNPNINDEALFKFKKSLEKNFSFLGGVTSYHFMTDIGLNVLKPDRVILRIFDRLGLIENEKDLLGAVKIGRVFSKTTNLPIRFIDIIFVLYGQLNQKYFECICAEKNPKCNKCGIQTECKFSEKY